MMLTRPVDAAFWAELGVSSHPVCPLPDREWIEAHTDDDLANFLLEREDAIQAMRTDPLNHGHEPATWRVLDALCGFPWMEDTEENRAWSLMVRRKLLKQDTPLKVVLLNGGNRGSKSEWASSRVMRLLLTSPGRRAWCFHQDEDMSKQYQQPLLYKYLPPNLRTEKGIKRNPTYIAYKPQTGFSEGHFVLPNYSDCDFRNYMQSFEKIQGGELDVVWCDELVPAPWVKELKARVATRSGWLLITFTPINGYTSTVKMFLDVCETTVESIAFVLPKDGKAPLPELALAGEDALKWLDDPEHAQPAVPEGRQFERVPRVMRCPRDRLQGVFFFHSFDNPFGNPRALYELYASESAIGQKMRFYGLATKAMSGQFPKFNVRVHVVPASAIPKIGTRYHVVDPCSGRNWAQGWALVDRAPIGKRIFIYREWPCPGKYVPGVGDMGVWAEPGDKLDGEVGPAQNPLGWGLRRYREQIDRDEGRTTPPAIKEKAMPTKFDQWDKEDYVPPPSLRKHRPEDGEEIYERIMDSRYGEAPTQTSEGQTTLMQACDDEVDLQFVPASGKNIQEGIDLINNLLDYDEDQPVGPLNSPRLFVSEECINHIFALQTWTGADGKHGACKDFVDLVRYLVLHDPEDWTDEDTDAA